MTQRAATGERPPTALADHLAGRREAVLEAWRQVVAAHPALTTGTSLPRTQFRDHIPQLLDAFDRVLRGVPEGTPPEGAEHGLQRWQQGYRLRELTLELGLLHACLASELDRYAQGDPQRGAEAAAALLAWGELCWQAVSDSAAEYDRLRRAEAAGQARDLAQALAELQELGKQRAESWREAAHDLRGNVGVVQAASHILGQPGVPEAVRAEAVALLRRNVTSLLDMLTDLMGLARLEAGHEQRAVLPFDAAALLGELCAATQALARERGLYLRAEGRASLPVHGDATKVRRIAQNLLLNALKYTERGGVTVAWSVGEGQDAGRWTLSVRDTGPGFHAGPGAPLAGALEEATAVAQELDAPAAVRSATVPAPDPRPVRQPAGEGIGLSIVKRLCELLDASLELESQPEQGSTFRVKLPRRYDDAAV